MRKSGIDLRKEYYEAKLKLSSLEARIINRCDFLMRNNNDTPIKINLNESTIIEVINHIIYIEKHLEYKNMFIQQQIIF